MSKVLEGSLPSTVSVVLLANDSALHDTASTSLDLSCLISVPKQF